MSSLTEAVITHDRERTVLPSERPRTFGNEQRRSWHERRRQPVRPPQRPSTTSTSTAARTAAQNREATVHALQQLERAFNAASEHDVPGFKIETQRFKLSARPASSRDIEQGETALGHSAAIRQVQQAIDRHRQGIERLPSGEYQRALRTMVDWSRQIQAFLAASARSPEVCQRFWQKFQAGFRDNEALGNGLKHGILSEFALKRFLVEQFGCQVWDSTDEEDLKRAVDCYVQWPIRLERGGFAPGRPPEAHQIKSRFRGNASESRKNMAELLNRPVTKKTEYELAPEERQALQNWFTFQEEHPNDPVVQNMPLFLNYLPIEYINDDGTIKQDDEFNVHLAAALQR